MNAPCSIRSLFAVSLLAVASVASSGPVTTAQQTGYLQDYHRLGHVGGVPLEQVWIEQEFDVRKYRSLYITPTRIEPNAYYRKGKQDHASAEKLSTELHAHLVRELQGAGIFTFVTDDPFFAAGRHGALTLETRITEIYSGDADKRYRPGFGAGATQIQIEGKVIENRTCRTLVEFADRRVHPGDAAWIGKSKASNADYLLGLDTRGVMRGIVKLFIYLREEGPPNDQR